MGTPPTRKAPPPPRRMVPARRILKRRPRYLVRRRGEAIGLWYNRRLQQLCVGGPRIYDALCMDVMTYFCRLARPPLRNIRIPVKKSGVRRIRRWVGYTELDFVRAVNRLLRDGVKELDVILEPVTGFGRLCQ